MKKIEKSPSKDYYKPMKTIGSFDNKKNKYMEYETKRDKDKNLLPGEYLDMITPYLRDMINDHKTPMKFEVHSYDKIFDYESQFGEWGIQLKMRINSISSKNFKETRTMHSISINIEILMGGETDDITDKLFESLLQRYQKAKEESRKREIEFMKMLIYCIIIFIK